MTVKNEELVDQSPLMAPGTSSEAAEAAEASEGQKQQMTSSEEVTTVEDLLRVTTAWRPYPLFIIISMSSLWSLCALSAISPAFSAGADASFYTIQKEFNMTGYSILDPAELVSSIYFFGNFLIGQMFAVIADRFGRRPIVVGSLLLTGVAGCFGALVPSFEWLLVARFIQGSCYTPLTTVNYVLSSESIPNRSQSLTSIFFGVSWVAGYCFLAPLSIWFPTWRQLQFATSLPNFLVAVFLIFTLPESLAYSVEKSDRRSVSRWIRRNELFSCRTIPHDLDAIMASKKQEKHEEPGEEKDVKEMTVGEMIRSIYADKSISRRIVFETILWICTFMTYCALSLTSTSVGETEPLMSFLFSGVVELPAYLFIPIVLRWAPRRPTRFLCHLIGATALLIMYFLSPTSYFHLPIWLVAKFCAACCYIFCFIYTSELFPTWCRSCCIGVCSTCCNIGAILAPHVFAVDAVMRGGQFLILTATGVLCSLLSLLQPETKEGVKN